MEVVMTEGTTRRRRARRPTEATARLERLRKRNADQLEAQREAERRIETALQAYVDAEVSITEVERDRDEEIASLEEQIAQARAAAQGKIDQIRAEQAAAVWHIGDAGRTVEQIADLLEMPQKDARRLLSAGRRAAESDRTAPSGKTGEAAATSPEQPIQQLPPAQPEAAPSEQRDLSGIDGQQNSTNALLVPAVSYSGC
jgi:DNA repair exonuclease SbcCD ATPase subunit